MLLSDLEEEVLVRWLKRNGLIAQLGPPLKSNTRTKPTYGLVVSNGFIVEEYNQTNAGGHITDNQLRYLLKKRGIAPFTSIKDKMRIEA